MAISSGNTAASFQRRQQNPVAVVAVAVVVIVVAVARTIRGWSRPEPSRIAVVSRRDGVCACVVG